MTRSVNGWSSDASSAGQPVGETQLGYGVPGQGSLRML